MKRWSILVAAAVLAPTLVAAQTPAAFPDAATDPVTLGWMIGSGSVSPN